MGLEVKVAAVRGFPDRLPGERPRMDSWTRAALVASLVALVAYGWAGRAHTVMVRAPEAAAEDFDFAYAADAERLLRGEDPKDEYRGPFYPLMLAAVSKAAPGLSMLRVGVWISTVAASGALLAAFVALRPLVGPQSALLAVIGTVVAAPFFRYATHEGIDMFFAFLSLASTAAMVEAGRGRRGWAAAAGVLAGLALDTRWNAGFLPLGAAVYFTIAARAPRLLWAYAAGLAAAWTPWLYANATLHGSAFHNLNYLNVAYAMYGRRDGGDWPDFFERLTSESDPFRSVTTVVLGDPVLFIRRWLSRLGEHAFRIGVAVGPLAWFALGGIAALLATPERGRRAAALAPVAGLLLTNATYTYTDRANLFAIPYVLAFAACFLWRFLPGRGPWRGRAVVAAWLAFTVIAARSAARGAAEFRASEGRYTAWAGRFLAATPGRPLVGDWNGDGRDGVGVYARGDFALRETASAGPPDQAMRISSLSLDIPLAARSGESGADRPGVYRQGLWSFPELRFGFGRGVDQPLMGDWDGDGRDEPGMYDGLSFHLSTVAPPRAQRADLKFDLANPDGEAMRSGIAVAGDWDGDGTQTMGLFHDGRWALHDAHDFSAAEHEFVFGAAGDIPLAGDWDGDGIDTVGVFRAGEWILTNVHAAGPGELRFRFP
jgi:hypothetical protein